MKIWGYSELREHPDYEDFGPGGIWKLVLILSILWVWLYDQNCFLNSYSSW